VSESLRVATLQTYGGKEETFIARFLMNVFNAPADCDKEESCRFRDKRDDEWAARDK
jgi:hypothetical protein